MQTGCGDECHESVVLVVENGSFDLGELGLQNIFNSLRLDTMSAYLELPIDPAEEMYTQRRDVDPSFVPSPVEPPELGVRNEFLCGFFG